MSTLRETFTNIADAIREKDSSAGQMTPADMPAAIRAISGGGDEITVIKRLYTSSMTPIPTINFIEENFNNGVIESGLAIRNVEGLIGNYSSTIWNATSTSSGASAFGNYISTFNNALKTLRVKNITSIKTANTASYNTQCFVGGLLNLKTLELGNMTEINLSTYGYVVSFHSTNLTHIDLLFTNCTQVPTLNRAANLVKASTSTKGNYNVIVPDALYDNWIVADQWSTIADKIIKESEYTPA